MIIIRFIINIGGFIKKCYAGFRRKHNRDRCRILCGFVYNAYRVCCYRPLAVLTRSNNRPDCLQVRTQTVAYIKKSTLIFGGTLFLLLFNPLNVSASTIWTNEQCGGGTSVSDGDNFDIVGQAFYATTTLTFNQINFTSILITSEEAEKPPTLQVLIFSDYSTTTDDLSLATLQNISFPLSYHLDDYNLSSLPLPTFGTSTAEFNFYSDVTFYAGETYMILVNVPDWNDSLGGLGMNGRSSACSGVGDTGATWFNPDYTFDTGEGGVLGMSFTDEYEGLSGDLNNIEFDTYYFDSVASSTVYYCDSTANSGIEYTTCDTSSSDSGFASSLTVLISGDTDRENSYIRTVFVRSDGEEFEPSSVYDYVDWVDTGEFSFQHGFFIPSKYRNASTTYWISSCLYSDNEIGTDTILKCARLYFADGYIIDENSEWFWDSGYSETADSVWFEYGCDDIGITDIKKGVQCALIWAFAPSERDIEKFTTVKNNILTLYPIGYATLVIDDFTSAFSSTSTDYFDSEVALGELFGQDGGTTTIDFDDLIVYKDIGAPLYEWIEFILWLFFVIWLIFWGVTRKL